MRADSVVTRIAAIGCGFSFVVLIGSAMRGA
jgi:hypothetical protein